MFVYNAGVVLCVLDIKSCVEGAGQVGGFFGVGVLLLIIGGLLHFKYPHIGFYRTKSIKIISWSVILVSIMLMLVYLLFA
jgi:hypothetical protein